MDYFKNKTVVVTGASSGIGRELSLQLAEMGATVLCSARRESRLQELNLETRNKMGRCLPVISDISTSSGQDAIENKLDEIGGDIDFLINNAAFGKSGDFSKIPLDDLKQIIDTNLTGSLALTQKIIPRMIQKNNGHIVFLTSLAGKIGFPNLAVYSASKFGIEGAAEAIREEVRSHGITITVARPGITETEFFEVAGMEQFKKDMRTQGKLNSAHTVANSILKQLPNQPDEITIGPDRWFLKLLPMIPYRHRLKILSLFG